MVLLELGFQEACWDVGFSCAPGRTPRAGGLVTFTGYFKRLYFLDSMHLKTKQNNCLLLILGRLISVNQITGCGKVSLWVHPKPWLRVTR